MEESWPNQQEREREQTQGREHIQGGRVLVGSSPENIGKPFHDSGDFMLS
jgi:hypothetical protein